MTSPAPKRTTPRWLRADPTEYWKIPAVAAVYALLLDGRVMYVGQTQNLFRRFNAYHMRDGYGGGTFTPWGQFRGEIVLKFSPSKRYGDWAMRELRLIRRLQPAWNCVGSVRERDFSGKHSGRKQSATTNLAIRQRLQ